MSDQTFGYSIFCDDLRMEVGGKLSYIGVYSNELFVHGEFPFTLPKFAISVHFVEPHFASEQPVTFKIFLPGDEMNSPSIEGELPMEHVRAEAALANPDREAGKVVRLRADVILSPLVFQTAGTLKVRAYRGQEEFKLGSLKVEKSTPVTP